MSAAATVWSVLIAGLAMYGLGLPLAWLLPAPSASRWVYRIAIGPLYAILLASVCAWVLMRASIPLHPAQLGALAIGAWVIAWWRRRAEWRLQEAMSHALGPAAIVGTAGITWFFSLAGYGLYLPNRDFKNHAFWVAQIAELRSADYAMVLRAGPLSPPSQGGFYPLGLHTLLGWAMPTSTWPTLGVTAASAVLAVSISLPLACVALARQFVPGDSALWVLTGFAVICFPASTAAFGIGSVVLLVATALYASAIACLWLWCQTPRLAESLALAFAGLGLFILHVSEAWGLVLVGLVALPTARWQRVPLIRPMTVVAIGVGLVAVVAGAARVLRSHLAALSSDLWDIEPNTYSVPAAIARALLQQPGGIYLLALVWLALVFTGIWITWTHRLSAFPIICVLVPLALAVVASVRGVPAALTVVTAPFYGSASRVLLLAVPALALLGCLPLARLVSPVGAVGSRNQKVRSAFVLVASVLLLAGLGGQLVPDRRAGLAASLAGAGDTVTVGAELSHALIPGETVLNLEEDGTANLYAASRVPVLAGVSPGDGVLPGRDAYDFAMGNLMRLSDPRVATALADLGVGYIAMGTSSLYWDKDSQVGYSIQELLGQPELSAFRIGTDMTILRYSEAGS